MENAQIKGPLYTAGAFKWKTIRENPSEVKIELVRSEFKAESISIIKNDPNTLKISGVKKDSQKHELLISGPLPVSIDPAGNIITVPLCSTHSVL